MLLGELLQKVPHESCVRFSDREIRGVCTDSRQVSEGDLFVCLSGGTNDGHDFARQAVSAGAAALAVERELDLPVPQIVVGSGRSAACDISAAFYGHPERRLKIIGVTGTNGKTTTAHMLASILTAAGKECGIIGTLGVRYGGKHFESALTTPDPVSLYKILADMAESGVEYVVTEVSAHALYFGKTDAISFETGVFTNFTEDHLDFFGTMEKYAAAKERLFERGRCRIAVLNSDDAEGRKIAQSCPNAFSYGLENPADVFAVDIREGFEGSTFVINLFDELYEIRLHMTGLHNVYNALAAAECARLLGVSLPVIAQGLDALPRVDGRLEHVARAGGADIFVDFAHTPDGLEKSLSALRRNCTGRLICVFGCGGNREVQKRPLMGEISARLADFSVLTSDNPRYEDAFDIILDIEAGVRRVTDEYVIVPDRESAIGYALDLLRAGDVLLVAGKGGERYQEVMGVRHVYSDVDAIKKLLSAQAEKTDGHEN